MTTPPAKKKAAPRKPKGVACRVVGPHPIDGVEPGGTVHVPAARLDALAGSLERIG